jgi:hypothetical protein
MKPLIKTPLVCAVSFSTTHMKLPAVAVPGIGSASTNPADWLQPIQGEALAFKAHDAGPANGITFRPFYDVHHQRYSVYWRIGKDSRSSK